MNIRKYRIGNDIPVTWRVLTNGERLSLEGRDLKVLCTDAFEAPVEVEWLATGCEISATVKGKNQKATGLLTLTLVENQGKDDQRIVDVMLVELVPHTWQADCACIGEMVLATAELSTTLSVSEINRLRAIAAAEDARVLAEQARVSAEDARVLAEQARAASETERVAAEQALTLAEAARVAAEMERAVAEKVRSGAEANRVSAETARAQAETARAAAEDARALAEQARANAEAARAAAEAARDTAEADRAAAETARVQAETARAQAETARASAEATRAASETNRDSAEQARATAEAARASSETSRAAAETERAAAEQVRSGAEANRVSAETARAQAETSRAAAEDARALAEQARATAEAARAQAEAARAAAESDRAAAETERAQAETARAAAEDARVLAEQARVTAEAARVAAEAARATEYEQMAEDIRGVAAKAAEAAQSAAAAQAAAQQLSSTVTQVGTNTSDIAALAGRVADLEFEQGDYYVEAYTPETTDATPVKAYGNKALLKQFDFILLDTTDNTGPVTHKKGVLKRDNLLRYNDGEWAPVVGITAAQAADALLELFAKSSGDYVQYCAAGEYDAEAYVENVLRPWYGGTLTDYDGPQLYKSDGEGGYVEAHALCPWETTETKYTIGLGAQHRLYVLDNVVGESGKVWKGLFLSKTEWDGIDLTPYALEPTAISPCPVCTIDDNGTHKTRSFFYLYRGDTNCRGASGQKSSFTMFAPGNRTFPRTTDLAQVENMNLARANNADPEAPVPFAEGGYFALDTFIIAQELLYSRRNPFRASQFGSGISSNDTCNSETTWRTNGGVRYQKSDADSPGYALWSANTPFYYTTAAKRSSWSDTLNKEAPKEQCMESQIVASFIAEFGIAATTDVATPNYFEVYGGKYYWMAVTGAEGPEDGYMNARIYRELTAEGTSWYDAEGNEVTYDIAVVLRMSLMGGANLSGDIYAYWGGGAEVVGTCGANTGNGTSGHRMDCYLQPDQSQWERVTTVSAGVGGRFSFEAEGAYLHLGHANCFVNGYALQRMAYAPKCIRGGGSLAQGECYYRYEAKYWSSTEGARVRVGLRFRGYAYYPICSPRYWTAYNAASVTTRNYGGSAQARFE